MGGDLRDILYRVREEQGALTPKGVVDAARDEAHPLHSRFEWDDAVAGEAYRLEQARGLIRSVRVTYTPASGVPSSLREFISVSTASVPAREYIPVDEVAESPLLAKLALQEAEREWRQLFSRYQHLAEFLALVREDVA